MHGTFILALLSYFYFYNFYGADCLAKHAPSARRQEVVQRSVSVRIHPYRPEQRRDARVQLRYGAATLNRPERTPKTRPLKGRVFGMAR
jgi:hypothetical protein